MTNLNLFDDYNAVHDVDVRVERLMRRRHPLWRLVMASVWDFLMLARQARVSLVGFVLLMAITTVYFRYGYHDYPQSQVPRFHIFSALFESLRLMALETGLPLPVNDPLGKILFFFVPLVGLALILQSILNFGRLLLDKGSRREGWQISLARTYRNHIIICGLGSVAYRVVIQLLEAGYDVVVVQHNWDSELVEAVLLMKVPVIHGDARQVHVLQLAGIQHARSLIVGTHDDLMNIEIALAARRNRPNFPVVLRIFSDELDTNLERTFGRNAAFSASALAAPTLATAAIGRAIAHVLPLPIGFSGDDGRPRALGVLQLTVAPSGGLVGDVHAIEDRFDVRVLRHLDARSAIKHSRRINSERAARFEPGDVVLLLGSLNMLDAARLSNHQNGHAKIDTASLRMFRAQSEMGADVCFDTVIVCGLGRIGYRVIRALQQLHVQTQIVVVCQQSSTSALFVEEMESSGVRVLYGDARRADTLQRAGIERACSVVALISDDSVNLQIGLAARRLQPNIDVVLRVFRDVLADNLTTMFGVHTTFSVAALAAPTLAASAVVRGIDYAIEIADRILSTMTITVRAGDVCAGRTVADIRRHEDILVVAIRRAGYALTPLKLDTRVEEGDEIVVLVDIARLDRLARDNPLIREAQSPALPLSELVDDHQALVDQASALQERPSSDSDVETTHIS